MSKSPPKNSHRQTTLQRLCQISAFVFVALILMLSIFGRKVVNTFVLLKPTAPFIGLVIILAILGRIIYSPDTENFGKWSTDIKITRKAIGTILTLACCAFLSELLIVDPIERIHFVKYGLLCILVFTSQSGVNTIQKLIPAIVLSASIGCLDESIQYFVPGRVFDLRDLLLNLTGSLYGAVFVCLALVWKTHIQPREST